MSIKKKPATKLKAGSNYSAFLHGLALVGLGLQSCGTELDRSGYALLDKEHTERRISTSYKLLGSNREFFDAEASFTLTILNTQSDSRVLSVRCTYEAHFHCDKCDEHRGFAQRFTDSELRIVMWPYFRQFVNDMSGRMAVPPILVPLYTVG